MNKPLWGVVAVLVVSLGVFAAVEHLRPVDEQGEPLLKTSSLEKTLFTPDSAAQPLAVAATSGDAAVADEGKGEAVLLPPPAREEWQPPVEPLTANCCRTHR